MDAIFIGSEQKRNKLKEGKEYSLSVVVTDTLQRHHINMIVTIFDNDIKEPQFVDKIKYYTFKNFEKDWKIKSARSQRVLVNNTSFIIN